MVELNGSSENGGMDQKRPLPARVTCISGKQLVRGTTAHFDDVGMLIMCRNPLPVNLKVSLKIQFPDLKEPLEIEATVVWSNAYGPDDTITPRGMAVKYDNLDSETAKILANFSLRYEVYGDQYRCYYT